MDKILINDFEGPLDLLLHLIKESKMDIYDINIVEITHQYLSYIDEMQNMNLDIASEYLVMASELIEMKSKFLLPKVNEEETDTYEEDMGQNLQRRLLEYKKYKESVSKFKELESIRHEVYTKSPTKINDLTDTKISNNSDITIFNLLEAFERVMDRIEYNKPLNTKITRKELSVADRIINIRNVLKYKKKLLFEELFETVTKEYVVVTFLSILEMVKDNEITVSQKDNFEKIYLERVD